MAKATVKSPAKSADISKEAAKSASAAKGPEMGLNRMPSVTPHLVCAGAAKAIEFYKKAFGAKELMRLEGPDGNMWHAIQMGEVRA